MIRQAELSDEATIRSCAEEAYAQYVAAIGKTPAPMVADFADLISRNRVFVIADPASPVPSGPVPADPVEGFIVFFPRGDQMFLENVAVRNASSGKGLGSKLIRFCEAEARRLGLSAVDLYTNVKMTGNLSLYPHLGYAEFDRREADGFERVYFRKILN